MRKLFISIATIVLSMIMCLTALTGCNLITTDMDRDVKQVVATVKIDKEAPLEKIYKKDMIMAYLNYGYLYEQYYGQTREQVFTSIIDNLVQTRVYVQNAIKELKDDADSYKNTEITNVWSAERYLNTEDAQEALYNTIKTFNDLIDSYEITDEEEKFGETLAEEVRATPTDAAIAEKEVDKADYISKGIDTNSTPARRDAFSKVIKLLKNNGILGNYKGQIEQTDYYKQVLKSNQESILLQNYENAIKDAVIATYDLDKLNQEYKNKVDEQKEMTNAEFVEKLSSASVSDPMLVGQNGSYGYVYNLLLGASEVQTAKIEAIDKNLSKTERVEKRREILEATIVKDLRSTWILSGYDFDENTKKFTGDYALLEDSMAFQGEVVKVQDATDDENAKYKVSSLIEYNLNDFIDLMETYVYGQTFTVAADSNPSIYKKVSSNVVVENYEKKINELLFAFSTDAGSLNTYKGYAVKPIPDGADQEQYVQEFADGARELLGLKGTSYVMVATRYGYHVMFYSQVLDVNYGYATLTDYLNAEYGSDKNWANELSTIKASWNDEKAIKAYKNNYLYLLLNSVSSTAVNNALTAYQRETLNTYIYDNDNFVKVYESRYSDLLK